MFRKLMKRLFQRPVTWLAQRVSSSPEKKEVFSKLNKLLRGIRSGEKSRGIVIPFELNAGRFIILSDQHKGTRDLADDFRLAEKNYLASLDYYFKNNFQFINLGDCEELWKYTPDKVLKTNKTVLEAEARFLVGNRYFRVFGNHDLEWKFPFQQMLYLQPIFGKGLNVYEGIELQTHFNDKTYSIFVAHGHQGDKRSDGNKFSMWVIAAIWTPIQRYLDISINTPSTSFELTDAHNILMYNWSATRKQLMFVSGHTHKPVFASLDHIDLLHHQIQQAKIAQDAALVEKLSQELAVREKDYEGKKFVKSMAYPSYFNSGCCCFSDGDLTGIEIEGGIIRLVRWKGENDTTFTRKILEESPLTYLFDQLPS